jgi:hypothetical protein
VVKRQWVVEISREVENWYATLKSKDKAMADRAFDGSPNTVPHCGCHTSGRSAAACSSYGSPARERPPGDVLHRNTAERDHADDLP